MKRLKNILLYDSSKFIHLALTISLYILSKTSYIALFLLMIELFYLFKKSKNLLIYSFLLFALIAFRFNTINNSAIPSKGTIIGKEESYLIVKNITKHYLYLDDTSNFELGMNVSFSGDSVERDYKNIIYGFDYQTFLLTKNIRNEIYIKEITVIDRSFVWQEIPEKISKYFNDNFHEKTSVFLNLFILGNKTGLDDALQNKTSKLGISHLFAISGMHLGLIIGLINYFLNFFLLKKSTHRLIICGCLVIYNLLTSFAISIVRASLLVIGLFFTNHREFSKTDILTFIMLGFLIYNPYLIYSIGFVLSFIIAFSIILGTSIWNKLGKINQTFRIGLLASVVSLPIIVNLNNGYGLLNPFYNVIFVFYVSFLLLPTSFFLVIIPGFEKIYLHIISGFESLLDISIQANYFLDFSFSSNLNKAIYWLILLYCLVNYHRIKKIRMLIVLVFGVSLNIYFKYLPNLAYVRILDVNQGDAIHIHDSACDILIDTGKPDDYNGVINYFKNQNINDLDYLIITHMHQDHYGEVDDLMSSLRIKKLMMNQKTEDQNLSSLVIAKEGDIINCGKIKMQIINAYNNLDENNNSIVVYAEIFGNNWLFTGDIEEVVEKRIISKYQFDLDVLKIAHHGSSSSTTKEFLERYNPDLAIISVGKNQYNHPSPELITRLDKMNIEVFRTDKIGSITFYYENITSTLLISSFKYQKKEVFTIKT